MIMRQSVALSMAVLGSLGYTTGVTAAETDRATHKHYERSPEADVPGPAGELAPRLQNLGKHVFPVTCRSARVQSFINQGQCIEFVKGTRTLGRQIRISQIH